MLTFKPSESPKPAEPPVQQPTETANATPRATMPSPPVRAPRSGASEQPPHAVKKSHRVLYAIIAAFIVVACLAAAGFYVFITHIPIVRPPSTTTLLDDGAPEKDDATETPVAASDNRSRSYQPFLQAAADGNAFQLMMTYVKLNPPADLTDGNGNSPAILAAKANDLASLLYLKKKGFDLYQRNAAGESPLSCIIPLSQDADAVQFLLHATLVTDDLISMAQPDSAGNSPLHLAAANEAVNLIEPLLEMLEAIDVNAQNAKGETALDIAVRHHHVPAIETLLKHHAVCAQPLPQDLSGDMKKLLDSFR